MTEREMEALIDRVPRIWAPYTTEFLEREESELSIKFDFILDSHWIMCYIVHENMSAPYVELEYKDLQNPFCLDCQPRGVIRCVWDESYSDHHNERVLVLRLIEVWMPIFRRGCWLSGVEVEASAHEKAEWLKGFTREELEAWNLKF